MPGAFGREVHHAGVRYDDLRLDDREPLNLRAGSTAGLSAAALRIAEATGRRNVAIFRCPAANLPFFNSRAIASALSRPLFPAILPKTPSFSLGRGIAGIAKGRTGKSQTASSLTCRCCYDKGREGRHSSNAGAAAGAYARGGRLHLLERRPLDPDLHR